RMSVATTWSRARASRRTSLARMAKATRNHDLMARATGAARAVRGAGARTCWARARAAWSRAGPGGRNRARRGRCDGERGALGDQATAVEQDGAVGDPRCALGVVARQDDGALAHR